jgi:hypothetical protein
MDEMESLSHTKWECKYDVVFIPKHRKKTLYGRLLQHQWVSPIGSQSRAGPLRIRITRNADQVVRKVRPMLRMIFVLGDVEKLSTDQTAEALSLGAAVKVRL